jgi:hypothetical protein
MKRLVLGMGLVAGAALAVVQRGPAAYALPPAPDGGSCVDIGGGAAGCCGDGSNSTAVLDSELPDGWGCQCNGSMVGVATGDGWATCVDPGLPGTGPGNGGGIGDPGGGGPGLPPDDECVQAPVVSGDRLVVDGKPQIFTRAERISFDERLKKNPPPKTPCKDKKKNACNTCSRTRTGDEEAVKKGFERCTAAIEAESIEMCHRGILADGRLASGHAQAEACFRSFGNHWEEHCPSAVPESETICEWSWHEMGSVCETSTEQWDECQQTYYRGSGATVDSIHAEGSARWNPVQTIEISLGGGASETVTWNPREGELAKCQKARDAGNRVAGKDAVNCAKGVNTKYVGGEKCYP